MAQEDLAEPAALVGKAEDGRAVGAGGHSHGDLTDAAGQSVQGTAEEVGNTAAKDGQGQAGDILVGTEGDGQEAVKQTAQSGRHKSCKEAQQQCHDGNGVGSSIFIGERTGKAGDAAQIHDAGDTQIQIAGFLRDDLTKGAEEDDGAKHDGRHEQIDHLLSAPFFLRKITR